MNPENWQDIGDARKDAQRRAHKMVFDYIDGGADDESALNAATAAYNEFAIKHRVLEGVDEIDTRTKLLGVDVAVPFFTCPCAGNRLFHTDGEQAVAAAAAEQETVYTLSTLSSESIEQIASATSGPKWFQLYVWKDRVLVKEMLDRARAAGYLALVLTVDFAVTGNRLRDNRNGFSIPPKIGVKQIWEGIKSPQWCWDYVFRPSIKYANLSNDTPAMSLAEFVNQQLDAAFNWKDAEWLLGEWNGPAIIKGVVNPVDARRAIALGFDAIQVSNHGGRQLSASIAPLLALEDVRQAVGSDVEVYLDGGIRRGTDILKAVALGANAVGVGRPYLYGLAAAGKKGVQRTLDLLADGIRRDMALAGVNSIASVDESLIHRLRN